MKQIPFNHLILKLPVILLALLTACTAEINHISEGEPDEIEFLFKVPAATHTEIETRSLGTETENRIADITILAFDPGSQQLKHKISGENLSYSGTNQNICKFKAPIIQLGTYDLVALANTGKFNINALTLDDTKEAVAQKLLLTSTTKWNKGDNIPMWGEIPGYTLTKTSKPQFTMTRMLARVHVVCDNTVTNFTLTSVQVYNYNTKGFLIPETSKFDLPNNKALRPTTYNTNMGLATNNPLRYSAATEVAQNKCEHHIYLFETATKGRIPPGDNWVPNGNWQDNPCLVIGGRYGSGGSPVTYYRVDFTQNKSLGLSLLRNFSYNVLIKEVTGPGYAQADVAKRSAPMNMVAATYPVSDPEAAQEAVEGPYYMTLTSTGITFQYGEHNIPITIKMKTNYRVENCAITAYKDEECTIPATDNWLSITPATTESGGIRTTNISLHLPVARINTQYVKVTVGRMFLVLKVTY